MRLREERHEGQPVVRNRGETYEIILRADNPGAWMFHCHNLPHARAGLMTHMMYQGVHSPYRIGQVSGRLTNQPE